MVSTHASTQARSLPLTGKSPQLVDNSRLNLLILVAIASVGFNLLGKTKSISAQPARAEVVAQSQNIKPETTAPPIAQKPSNLAISKLKPSDPLTANQVLSLFEGGADSPVARAIGPAEGTRTADGSKTEGYFGHEDPGDYLLNIGTFSYSNVRAKTNIASPEEADRHYLKKLQNDGQVLLEQQQASGTQMTLEEWINAIDLSNQSPQAGMGWVDNKNPGFIANLILMKKQGLQGQEAIKAARVESFRNNETNSFEAWTDKSGLEIDQNRRILAVIEGVEVWQQQQQNINPISQGNVKNFSRIENQNPYGIKKWKSYEQQTQALFWQAGAWDALNNRSASTLNSAYQEGYQFADTHR